MDLDRFGKEMGRTVDFSIAYGLEPLGVIGIKMVRVIMELSAADGNKVPKELAFECIVEPVEIIFRSLCEKHKLASSILKVDDPVVYRDNMIEEINRILGVHKDD